MGFIDLNQYPHDSNLTINIIWRMMLRVKELPPILYIQLDNTGRENKNRYVIAWCALLVEYGVYEEVFLPVL